MGEGEREGGGGEEREEKKRGFLEEGEGVQVLFIQFISARRAASGIPRMSGVFE